MPGRGTLLRWDVAKGAPRCVNTGVMVIGGSGDPRWVVGEIPSLPIFVINNHTIPCDGIDGIYPYSQNGRFIGLFLSLFLGAPTDQRRSLLVLRR